MQPDRFGGMSAADLRRELRTWLEANCPPEWRDPALRLRGADAAAWQKTLHDGGWRAPAWPREHGGLGLSLEQQIAYQREMEDFGAARTLDQGVRMVGPILIGHGTPAQQAQFLAPMLSGEHQWCQGYSEPGAGSDLASLSTKASAVDGGFSITGQKTWTTQASNSTHIYVLARTSAEAKKQQGITLFLLPMDSPGITVRPIVNLMDEDEFCEVFFDDVRVLADAVVGSVGGGWGIAKALLGFERFTQGSPALARHAMNVACDLAEALGLAGDARFAERLARLAGDLHDAAALFEGVCADVLAGQDPQLRYSVAKLVSAELFQRAGDCLLDLAGEPGAPLAHLRHKAERLFLLSRPVTIFGGTAEIQRDIMARMLLPR